MSGLISIISLLLVVGLGVWFATQNFQSETRTPSGATDTTTESITAPIDAAEEAKQLIEGGLGGGTKPSTPSEPNSATLDLSGQGLTKAPESIFKRTDIRVLNLSDNALTGALQAEERHLSNLRVLDLSHNHFTGVPAEVGQLSKLEVLDLSYNKLTGLPYEIGNLKNLKVLDLRGNDYAKADLEIIKKGLPSTVEIRVDN